MNGLAPSRTFTSQEQREHRAKWRAALRSGDYAQACGCLCEEDDSLLETRYCCLGVACEISGLSQWEGICYLEKQFTLPEEVRLWLGLATKEGYFGVLVESSLASLNDAGSSFSEIADVIASEPPGLIELLN